MRILILQLTTLKFLMRCIFTHVHFAIIMTKLNTRVLLRHQASRLLIVLYAMQSVYKMGMTQVNIDKLSVNIT